MEGRLAGKGACPISWRLESAELYLPGLHWKRLMGVDPQAGPQDLQ